LYIYILVFRKKKKKKITYYILTVPFSIKDNLSDNIYLYLIIRYLYPLFVFIHAGANMRQLLTSKLNFKNIMNQKTATSISSLTELRRKQLVMDIANNLAKLPKKSPEYIDQIRVLNMLSRTRPELPELPKFID